MKKAMETTLTHEDDVKKMSEADWFAKGKELFGEDPRAWRFVCPNCKHIQTIQDFIDLREHGIEVEDAQVAYYCCIGRYDTRIEKIGRLEANPQSPCDYVMGGFFPLVKTIVVDGSGKENRVFEFAEHGPAENSR